MIIYLLLQILAQNAVLYMDLIYKRYQENTAKLRALAGVNGDSLQANGQIHPSQSLFATCDELEQVLNLYLSSDPDIILH